MITAEEIIRFAKAYKLKPYQQEKQYLQTAILSAIYTEISDELVFKGGTALFLFYGLNRFSEDLDFTKLKKYNQDKLIKTISDVLTIIHIKHEIKPQKSITGENFKIEAQDPLYKRPTSKSYISIEISDRNDIILPPDVKEIIPIYNDLRPFTILVMKKEEILAEKIRALMIRGRARDLYDIAFLLKKEVPLKYKIINKKLSYYNKTFKTEEFALQAKSIKNLWQSELHGLVPKIPVFEDILKFTINQFKN